MLGFYGNLPNFGLKSPDSRNSNYSETSNNGLSERWTTSVQWTKSMPPIALPIEIPYSGKLWQALNLVNQSCKCIGEF